MCCNPWDRRDEHDSATKQQTTRTPPSREKQAEAFKLMSRLLATFDPFCALLVNGNYHCSRDTPQRWVSSAKWAKWWDGGADVSLGHSSVYSHRINDEFEPPSKWGLKPQWRWERKILILDFGKTKISGCNFGSPWWMDLLQVGDVKGSGVSGRGRAATAAVQTGQMACQEGVKTRGILMMSSPQRAFRQRADVLGSLGAIAINI